MDASKKIELPVFFREGIFISNRLHFVDPTSKDSINDYWMIQTEYLFKKDTLLSLYRVNDVEYVKEFIERSNLNFERTGRHRRGVAKLDDPEYYVTIKNGECIIAEREAFIYKTNNSDKADYEDSDIIRTISEGNGDAYGYGD